MPTAEREELRQADPNEVTPDMLAAAWEVVRARYPHGRVLGPGPGFREAIAAALARRPPNDAAYDRETIRVVEGQREQYRTKMKAALAEVARLSAEVERLRAALDDSQSLLAAIQHIGPDREFWAAEDMTTQVVEQICHNRVWLDRSALSVPSTDAPAAAQEGSE